MIKTALNKFITHALNRNDTDMCAKTLPPGTYISSQKCQFVISAQSQIKMFKVFILVVALIAVTRAGEGPMDPEMEKAMETCKQKLPDVKDDDIKQLCTPGYTATNENVKCFVKCLGQETGKVDAKGGLIKDALLKMPPTEMDPEKLKASLDGCIALKGATDCDTAYVQWQCLLKAAKSG